jgi:alpha-tubulin suppressor-like RCC1 family protein
MEIYSWGNNEHHEINESNTKEMLVPAIIGQYPDLVKVEVGDGYSLFLNKSGELFGWGDLNWIGVKSVSGIPQKISLISEPILDMSANGRSLVVLAKSGQVYQLGGTGSGWAEEYVSNHFRKINITDGVSISTTDGHGFAVRKDGTLAYWSNQITGYGTAIWPIKGFKDIVSVSAATANDEYVLAIDSHGEIWAWGNNTVPQFDKLPKVMTSATNATLAPLRFYSKAEITYTKEKLQYRLVSANSYNAIALTKQNEMLFFGFSMSSTFSEADFKNISYVKAYGNLYWIQKDKLWIYGNKNDIGQHAIGVKSYYEKPQPIQMIEGFRVSN